MGLFRRKEARAATDRPDGRGTATERRRWLLSKTPKSNGEGKKKKKKKREEVRVSKDEAARSIGLRLRRMVGMELPAEEKPIVPQGGGWPARMFFASGWRRQAREEVATAGERKTMSLDGVGAKFKVPAVILVILVVTILWRRWLQRKRTPLVTEERVPAVVPLDEAEGAADLEQGRASETPTAEVSRVAGCEERGAPANLRLGIEEEKKTGSEMGSAAAPQTMAFNETLCQTEDTKWKALTENNREGTTQGEGAAQPSVKEPPTLNRASAGRSDRDEVASSARQDQRIDQQCAETTNGLAAEEQYTENGADITKVCLEEQQNEAGVQGDVMAAEKPGRGGGGVPAGMEPEVGLFAGKSGGGEEPVKAETEPMGLGRYAAVDRMKGAIQGLFVENTGEFTGSEEMVAFTKQVIDVIGIQTERLTVLGELGRGKCGKVDEVQLIDFPEGSYALKTISGGAESHTAQAALVEMAVFARVAGNPHNNVLGALAVHDTASSMPMLLPKAAGDLESFMNNDTISLGDQLGLVVDLVTGAQHLHGLNIVHRDIKPANLLIFWTEELGLHGKLGDFGLSREINEICPAMSGTPGFMAHECMSLEPVRGAAAHDVVAAALVLLLVCLKKELRSPNLFTNPALMNPEDWDRLRTLFHRAKNLGENVSAEMELFQVELTRRTMEDGSFAAMMLSAEQMNPSLKSPEILLEALPSFLTTDPEERQDMASLLELVERLAAINQNVEQEAGVEESENVTGESGMERACLAVA